MPLAPAATAQHDSAAISVTLALMVNSQHHPCPRQAVAYAPVPDCNQQFFASLRDVATTPYAQSAQVDTQHRSWHNEADGKSALSRCKHNALQR